MNLNPVRSALIIANYKFEYATLRDLDSPRQDAESLADVLSQHDLGNFEVKTLLNENSYNIKKCIEDFFVKRNRNDLLLLYFSGHGIKCNNGQLCFATSDTQESLLLSTSISASFIKENMKESMSKRQVLILDCCYSGAFERVKSNARIYTMEHFKGEGVVILTASDSMQYAFEEEPSKSDKPHSIFTKTIRANASKFIFNNQCISLT